MNDILNTETVQENGNAPAVAATLKVETLQEVKQNFENADIPNDIVVEMPQEEAMQLKPKVELIPYYLHVKQSEIQAHMGNAALKACEVLADRLRIHSPKSPAFEEVQKLLQHSGMLVADFMQLEEVIQVARKTVNKELYGKEEPNKEEVNAEDATGNDSTERALA